MKIQKNISFAVAFTSCFKQDTVTLSINNEKVFDKISITSDFVTGLTYASTYHFTKSNELVVIADKNEKRLPFIGSKKLLVKINRNQIESIFEINLADGRNIIIEGCELKPKIRQFKNKISVE
ncbi:hypothetical protein [Dyadobacter sp. NIV53]|uniref:hypothetical protein n=1 Tax=Dyadobacter sp. NIV53 TaxID=2861765 RepID=UPI001C886E51|nr:hypothetical protein [Dyadobacter sp. NIV53]